MGGYQRSVNVVQTVMLIKENSVPHSEKIRVRYRVFYENAGILFCPAAEQISILFIRVTVFKAEGFRQFHHMCGGILFKKRDQDTFCLEPV